MVHPSETLFHAYQAYKSSTKYVIEWLETTLALASEHKLITTTNGVVEAAQKVALQVNEVPISVISTLQRCIEQRKAVTQIYKSQSAGMHETTNLGNHGHEAFVERLESVLQILRPLQAQVEAASPQQTITCNLSENRFHALSEPDTSSKNKENYTTTTVGPPPEEKLSDADVPSVLGNDVPGSDLRDTTLEDDTIGEAIELSHFIYEMDSTLSRINKYWTEAAQEQLPIPLVALLSTAAMHAIGERVRRIKHIATDQDSLNRKWRGRLENGEPRLRFTEAPDLETQIGGHFADGHGLFHSAFLIRDCRTSEQYRKISPYAGCPQDPSQFIQKPRLSYFSADGAAREEIDYEFNKNDNALDMMQESMRQLLVSSRAMEKIELSTEDTHICSEPLLPHLRHLLANIDAPIPVDYIFGMEMLLSSFKSFMWADGTQKKPKCRVMALQLAQAMQKSMLTAISVLDATSGIREKELQLHLQSKAERLAFFTSENRFDLYYQAPWTAGCHMIELLDYALEGGLSLCTDLGYVCATLHLYNALTCLSPPLQNIGILDDLCKVFLSPLFQGNLPRDNFCSKFRRTMGASLDKKTDNNHRGNSRFKQPSTEVGRRIFGSSMSLCMELLNVLPLPTDDFWVRVSTGSDVRYPSNHDRFTVLNAVHGRPYPATLDTLRDAMLPEFTGAVPTMRINYFSIFEFCCELLQRLGERLQEYTHYENDIPEASLRSAYYHADRMLSSISEHLEDVNKRDLIKHWRQFKIVKFVFQEFASSAKLSDHLWGL